MAPLILGLFLDFWYGTISRIAGFVLKPLFDYLVDQNILSDNYLQIATDFVEELLRKFLFARDVIINVTGVPVQVFVILGNVLALSFGLYTIALGLKFALNAWSWFRTGSSVARAVSKKR